MPAVFSIESPRLPCPTLDQYGISELRIISDGSSEFIEVTFKDGQCLREEINAEWRLNFGKRETQRSLCQTVVRILSIHRSTTKAQ